MTMYSAIVLVIFTTWITLGVHAQSTLPCVPSNRESGRHAFCGGFVNMPCPKKTDTCKIGSGGSSIGPCCLGCRPTGGKPTGDCSVYKPCKRGYQCNYSRYSDEHGTSRGVCCSSRGGRY